MCTIITVNQAFWAEHRGEVLEQIRSDAAMNSDGVNVVLLGSNVMEDLQLSGMRVNLLLPAIIAWMDAAGPEARLFIHQRMATTIHVGLAFNHGFTDTTGTIIMHNGILHSKAAQSYSVDSFALIALPDNGDDAIIELLNEKESYANVFRIRPNDSSYQIIRLSTGSLYTDGAGNYSSYQCGPMIRPVEHYNAFDHSLPGRVASLPEPVYEIPSWVKNRKRWWQHDLDIEDIDDWRGPSNPAELLPWGTAGRDQQIRAHKELDIGFEEPTAEDLWELDEKEILLCENEYFFVVWNEETGFLYVYGAESGALFHKEEGFGDDLAWHGRTLLSECSAGMLAQSAEA